MPKPNSEASGILKKWFWIICLSITENDYKTLHDNGETLMVSDTITEYSAFHWIHNIQACGNCNKN